MQLTCGDLSGRFELWRQSSLIVLTVPTSRTHISYRVRNIQFLWMEWQFRESKRRTWNAIRFVAPVRAYNELLLTRTRNRKRQFRWCQLTGFLCAYKMSPIWRTAITCRNLFGNLKSWMWVIMQFSCDRHGKEEKEKRRKKKSQSQRETIRYIKFHLMTTDRQTMADNLNEFNETN